MGFRCLSLRLQVLSIQPANISVELGVLRSNPISVRMDVHEEFRVVLQLILDIFNDYNPKVLTLALSPEGVTHEFKSDILQDSV